MTSHNTSFIPPTTSFGPGVGGVQAVPPGGLPPGGTSVPPFSVAGVPPGGPGGPGPGGVAGVPPGALSTPGNIAAPSELDGYVVQLQPGVTYTVAVSGASHGQMLPDPFVAVADLSTGQMIAVADNTPDGGRDPMTSFVAPAGGNYMVAVGDATGGTGSYVVAVTDPQGQVAPGFFVLDYQAPPAGQQPGGQFGGPPSGTPSFGVLGVQDSVDADLNLFG